MLEALASPGVAVRVLVVEDEHKVAHAIREGLSAEGYEVVLEHTGEGAIARVDGDAFAIVLLDLTLPGLDGLQVLEALRRRGADTRVLVLTARDALEDRVVGLESGADDYMVKPFAFAELLARIRAVLRRGRLPEVRCFEVGDLQMDVAPRRVTRGGQAIDLTYCEFELLACLLRSAGQVVSRETLVRDVWSETSRSTTLANVVDVHIARLRRKVDVGGCPS